MVKTGAIRAGRAFVELFADDSKLVRGLRWAEARLKAFGRSVQTIGRRMMTLSAAIVTPLIGSAKVFSRVGDQVAKMSKRTGVSVETLSELRYVASQTGTEFESLEMAFRKMQRSIYDAGRGLSTAVDALDDLGLTFEDLDGLTPEAQFKRLADRIGQLEDPTKKAAIAMSLFGRTGTNLLPMFAVGSRGIEQLQQKARDLGLTISGHDAKAAEDFTDAMDSLWKVLKQGTFLLGAALASDLQAAAEWLTRAAINTSTWIKENKKLISNLFRVTVGVGAAGAALVILGTAIQGLVKPLALIGIGKAVGIGGLVIALGAIATKTEAGGKALDWLGGRFTSLRQDADTAWKGISDALKAGDIALAGKILWLELKSVWLTGIKGLKTAWADFLKWLAETWASIKFGASTWRESAVDNVTKLMLREQAASKKRKAWRKAGLPWYAQTQSADQIPQANRETLKKDLANIDQWLKDALEGAAQEHADKIAEAAGKFSVELGKITDAYDARTDDSSDLEAELAATRRQLERLAQDAQSGRWLAEADSAAADAAARLESVIADSQVEVEAVTERSRGFGLTAGQELWSQLVQSLGKGGDIQQKQLSEQKKTNRTLADQTEKLTRAMEDVGTFGP